MTSSIDKIGVLSSSPLFWAELCPNMIEGNNKNIFVNNNKLFCDGDYLWTKILKKYGGHFQNLK